MSAGQKSLLAGGGITAEEIIAVQLWYTYVTEIGEIHICDPVSTATKHWIQLEEHQRDAWLRVAAVAQEIAS